MSKKIAIICFLGILIPLGILTISKKVTGFQIEGSKSIKNNLYDSIIPLSKCYDNNLQEKLESVIDANSTWKKLVDNKKMSIGIVDLTDDTNQKFASVNGDEMMYAASLPKIAVLLAVEDAIEKGEVAYTDALEDDMRLMISKSNNQATTRIIDLLGYKKIEAVLTDKKYNFYRKDKGGGLWVGKRYAGGGITNREPLKNLSHAATANQVCRFYYLLSKKYLISKERSEHMLKMLADPEINHKFVHTLKIISPGAKLYRKSGTWKSWHSDSVMVIDGKKKYILVALINDNNGGQIIKDLVIPLEKTISSL